MQKQNYSTVIETVRTPNEMYTAINNVPQWWTKNFEGSSHKLNVEFTVTFGETFFRLKVIELVNDYKVVWEVTVRNYLHQFD